MTAPQSLPSRVGGHVNDRLVTAPPYRPIGNANGGDGGDFHRCLRGRVRMPGRNSVRLIPVRPKPGTIPVMAVIVAIESVMPGRVPDGKVVRIEVRAVVAVFPPGVDAVGLKGSVVSRIVVDCMDRTARDEILTLSRRLCRLVTRTRASGQKKSGNDGCQMSHIRV